jgi:hypothetical protein
MSWIPMPRAMHCTIPLPLNEIKTVHPISNIAGPRLPTMEYYLYALYQCMVVDDSTVMNALLNTLQSSRAIAGYP